MKKNFTLLLIGIFIGLPNLSLADSVNIQNSIYTSVNTGGNTVVNGESSEGTSKSSVKVYTEVNGEVLEDFEKQIEGTSTFEMKTQKDVGGARVETSVNINTDKKSSSTDFVKEIGDEEEKQEVKEVGVSFVRKILNYVFRIFKF